MTADLYKKNNKFHVMLSWYQGKERKQKSVSTGISAQGNNKRKAEAERKRILEEWESTVTMNHSETLFSEYLKEWLEERKHAIAETTYHSYKNTIENIICPYFAERKITLSELKPYHIQHFYKSRLDSGVTGNTIHHYQANIHKALKDAVRSERVHDNPAAKVALPKVERFHGDYYSSGELKKLVDAVMGTRLETAVLLAAWFGLRRGEAAGVRWEAINFDTKTLSVLGTITNKGDLTPSENEVFRPTGKTSTSIRSFPLSDNQVKYFRALRKTQKENRILCGDSYDTRYLDFVCVDAMGERLQLSYISRVFSNTIKKLGLRKIRFHDLRHTNITLLLESGATIKELQEWAGHANFSTTADIYAHVQSKSKVKLTDAMSNIISVNC